MSKFKFNINDQVKPNKKATLYLRYRSQEGESFSVSEQLGEGYYKISNGTESFKVPGSYLDLVKVEAKKNLNPKGTQELVQKLQEIESNSSDVAVGIDESSLTNKVKEWIRETGSKISEIEDKIKPEREKILTYASGIELARNLNRIPSPNVWKLMHQLVSINPELGNKSLIELYQKAETILEETVGDQWK